jgi:hypothetical protein
MQTAEEYLWEQENYEQDELKERHPKRIFRGRVAELMEGYAKHQYDDLATSNNGEFAADLDWMDNLYNEFCDFYHDDGSNDKKMKENLKTLLIQFLKANTNK